MSIISERESLFQGCLAGIKIRFGDWGDGEGVYAGFVGV